MKKSRPKPVFFYKLIWQDKAELHFEKYHCDKLRSLKLTKWQSVYEICGWLKVQKNTVSPKNITDDLGQLFMLAFFYYSKDCSGLEMYYKCHGKVP